MTRRGTSHHLVLGHLLGIVNAYAMIDSVAEARYGLALFNLAVMVLVARRV